MARVVAAGGLTEKLVDVAEGEFVFREGELGTEMYIVHRGRLEVLKRIGGEERSIAVFEQGDFFGELALLDDRPRSASVRALTDASLIPINGTTFDRMLHNNPEIVVRMMRKFSRRLRAAHDLIESSLGQSASSEAHGPLAPEPEKSARPVSRHCLVHQRSGMELRLSTGSETTIGRRDPVTGIAPDIDLTPVDSQRSSSRRHAKLYHRGNKFFLAEEIGTMNGTFVNGERLETGVPVEVKDGDAVRFGLIDLEFRT